MAPPRSGWSRRAQYGAFFSFIATIVAVVIGLVLLTLSIAAPATFKGLRGLALDTTAPLTVPLREVSATYNGLVSGAGDYWDSANQNGKLKRERSQMARQLLTARAILQENAQLKAALQLRERTPDVVTAGRLVGSSFQTPRRFAIFSAGTRDGVRIGMPIRAAQGLIGRVVDVGGTASRILLVTDRANIVPARLVRTGQAVLTQGNGDSSLEIKPLEVGRNPFRPGDVIITSGTGGLYPPLVAIARVIRLDGDNAVAVPLADPSAVSFAIAEKIYEPAALAPDTPKDQDLQ